MRLSTIPWVCVSGSRGIGKWACVIIRNRVLLAVDPECVHGGMVVDATEREIEQYPEVLITRCLGRLESFDQVTQLGIEQGVDRLIGLGGDHLGSLEQVTIHRASEIDGSHCRSSG